MRNPPLRGQVWPEEELIGGQELAEHAVVVAHHLTTSIREHPEHHRGHIVASVCDEGTRRELIALIAVLAAMVPAHPSVGTLLEWAAAPPPRWSRWTLNEQLHRYRDGARDESALAAIRERERRAAAMSTRSPRVDGRGV